MPKRIAPLLLIFVLLVPISTPVHAQSTFNLNRSLSVGMTGQDVSSVQQILQNYGFFSYPRVTGYFGLRTKEAVIAFQRANGIDPIGVVGPRTRAKLLLLLPAKSLIPLQATTTLMTIPKIIGEGPHRTVVSTPTQVTSEPAGDTVSPTVSVTFPLDNSFASSTVTLTASASDDTAVTGVQFKIDEVPVGSEITSAPYAYSWDSTEMADGSHTVVAIARDAAGNIATSTAVTITVDNTAPVVAITAPPTTLSYSFGVPVTLSANVTETNVKTVEFKIENAFIPHTVRLDTVFTSGPYTTAWTVPGDNSYILTVTVTDMAGNVTSTQEVITTHVTLEEA